MCGGRGQALSKLDSPTSMKFAVCHAPPPSRWECVGAAPSIGVGVGVGGRSLSPVAPMGSKIETPSPGARGSNIAKRRFAAVTFLLSKRV